MEIRNIGTDIVQDATNRFKVAVEGFQQPETPELLFGHDTVHFGEKKSQTPAFGHDTVHFSAKSWNK